MNHRVLPNLKRNVIFFLLMLCATLLSVTFLDKNLALWSHQFRFDQMLRLDYFTENSPYIISILGLYLIIFKLPNFSVKDKILLIIGMAIVLLFSLELKDDLKSMLGRNWPEYWLGVWNPYRSPYDNSYGFHFNLTSTWQGSMPSGHTTFVGGLTLMLWQFFPRWRKLLLWFCISLVVSLVMLNHHYLGDCCAGFALAALLNTLFILYCSLLFNLQSRRRNKRC